MSLGLIDGWAALEQQLGFEVDARVIAYAVGSGQLPPESAGQLMTPTRHSACCGRAAPRRATITCSTTSRMLTQPARPS